MGKGIISITPELLFSLLRLDDSFNYCNAEFNFQRQTFDLLIQHDLLPEKRPECMAENVQLEFRIINNKMNISLIRYQKNNEIIEIQNYDYIDCSTLRFYSIIEAIKFLNKQQNRFKNYIEISNSEISYIKNYLKKYYDSAKKLKDILNKNYENIPINVYTELLNLSKEMNYEKGDIDE